jgi:hypothetical protein
MVDVPTAAAVLKIGRTAVYEPVCTATGPHPVLRLGQPATRRRSRNRKTCPGERNVDLDPVTVEMQAVRNQQRGDAVVHGSWLDPTPACFHRANGSAVHADYVSRRFEILVSRRRRTHDSFA